MTAPLQVALLNYLRSREGAAASYREIIEALYPEPDRETRDAKNSVDCVAWRLRKLGYPIKTVWGFGLRFEPNA